MYKKILVPLDGSDLSEQVLVHAKMMSLNCQIPEIILLRVLRPMDNSTVLATLGQKQVKEMEEQEFIGVQNYMIKLADTFIRDGVDTKAVIIRGEPAHEILEYIDNNQIDIVVMSTHGRTGPSRWILGSVADKIVKHSSVPVLTIRKGNF